MLDESCSTRSFRSQSNIFPPIFFSKRKKASDRGAIKSDAESVPTRKRIAGVARGDNPDSEPAPRSWIWRILKVALPFQLALVALFCAACLLEPHCCEAANTLNLSLTPQLRYVRGPPPVWAVQYGRYNRRNTEVKNWRILWRENGW